jgi:subtilisin family serine protease
MELPILDAGLDRTHGDFGPGNTGAKVVASYDFVHDDPNSSPDLNIGAPYHGTAVAAIAAAETNDGVGVSGVCGGFGQTPGCSILDGKVLGTLSISQGLTEWLGTTDCAAAAVNWALANGGKVKQRLRSLYPKTSQPVLRRPLTTLPSRRVTPTAALTESLSRSSKLRISSKGMLCPWFGVSS